MPALSRPVGNADLWWEKQSAWLLPVDYFLVTFTVPEGLRDWIRSHPQSGYETLFAASARALQDLAANPQRLGAQLGMLGVLHTWSRTLIFHPHIHYLVPAGGWDSDRQQWIDSRPQFLVRVEPLSDHFRTLFKQGLQRQAPEAFRQIPAKVWTQRWITHSQAAGSGQKVLRYLSRYVFQTATGNRIVPRLPGGQVRWNYRQSQTGHWQSLVLEPPELVRRFLQHVLPSGFHRVRRFGWLHPAAKAKREAIQAWLTARALTPPFSPDDPLPHPDEEVDPFDELETAESFVEARTLPHLPLAVPPPRCPCCDRPMTCVGRWRPPQSLQVFSRGPPAA